MRRGERLTAAVIGFVALVVPFAVVAVSLGSVIHPFDVSRALAGVPRPVGTALDMLGWGRYASTAALTVPVLFVRQ